MELLKKPGVRFGLISAMVYAIGLVLVRFAGIEAFTSWPKAFPWLIMLAIAFVACVKQLAINGGRLPFPKAMVIILTVMVLTEASAALTEWLIYQVDTELPARMKEVKLSRTAASFEQFDGIIDYAEGDREEIMSEVENANYNFSAGNAVLKFVTWIIIDFLFALLLAAIVRKEPKPVE